MSKGYADYLIAMAREIDRDFQRDADGVEVPLFSSEYEEWLKAEGKLSEQSQDNYDRWLEKADAWICESDWDFWTLLKKAWVAADFDTARKLIKEYESKLLIEKAKAEKDKEYSQSGKEIGNWVSAFHKYCKFFEELMRKAETDKKVLAAMIEASRMTASHLFLDIQFILWGISKGISEKTMDSYASYMRRINRELFSKTGHDILREYLPGYVKTKNAAKIDEMFSAMDAKLTERIDACDETEMPVDSLVNVRVALRKYAEFIKSILNG